MVPFSRPGCGRTWAGLCSRSISGDGMTEKADFEPRLESLRGIAALVVATHHGLTSFDRGNSELGGVGDSILYVLLQLFPNPGMAVLFFFVLSGYVLGKSLERDSNYFR